VCLLDNSQQCIPAQTVDLEKQNDIYEPIWSPPRTFTDIPADSTVQVYLADADWLLGDTDNGTDYVHFDPIATVNINADDIAKALSLHGKVYHCPVIDQSDQLMFVNFSAVPSAVR